jgi:tetratricopeptide (TPR) repeat protein
MMKTKKVKKQHYKIQKTASQKTWIRGGLFIAILTFLFYSQTFRFDFVNWDDYVNIYENQNVVHFNVKGIFSEHIMGNYNPLANLTFALEYMIVKDNPKLYHINNAILHIVCTLLVFIFMKNLGLSFWASFLVSLLFGIHPMHVESVAWITERKDVLFTTFYLLSLLYYIAWRRNRKLALYLASILLFILSLMSKIQAVALPLSLLLVDYWFDKKLSWKTLANKIPFLFLSLITGLVGVYFLQKHGSLDVGASLPLLQRLFIGSYSYMVYIIKSIVPYQLSAFYPLPGKLTSIYYLSMIPALAIALGAVATYKTNRIFTFGILFFTVNIMFMLQIIGAGAGFIADRFTYIPYIGLFLLYAFWVEHLFDRYQNLKILLITIITGYLMIISVQTVKQIKVWENGETLWMNVIKKQPYAILGYNNLANYYNQNDEHDKALKYLNMSIKMQPLQADVLKDMGKIFHIKGDLDKALENYNRSISIDPDNTEVYANRGAVFGSKGEFENAINDLTKVLMEKPENTNALSNRGFAYFQIKEFEKAIADYREYLQLKPGDAEIINLTGLCYAGLKDFDRAILQYDSAIQIEPAKGLFYYNRSLAYNSLGNTEKALTDARRAQELGMSVNPRYLEMLNKSK